MEKPRENLEQQALKRFEDTAKKYGYQIFKGQGSENRIPVEGNAYFQFGDLRVDTANHHIVIEVESAGGVTNLAKYWYCIENQLIYKPVILLHIFRQISESDYASHLVLWDLLWKQMSMVLGNKIEATRYTYRDSSQLENVVIEFEKHLKLYV